MVHVNENLEKIIRKHSNVGTNFFDDYSGHSVVY